MCKGDTNDVSGLVVFFREKPFFLLPWVILAAVQVLLFNFVPAVVAHCKEHGLEVLGLMPAMKMAAFAVCAQFAVHGFVTVNASKMDKLDLKIQDEKKYDFQVESCALHSSLMLIVSMSAYALTPMRSAEASWWEIFVGYSILSILHDAWFYAVHRAAHTRSLYGLIHKTHHSWKQPTAFAAYYIRSPSQILQEHAALVPCMLFLPVPMMSFFLYQYIGAPVSMIEHSGYRLGELPLPVLGCIELPWLGRPSVNHLLTILGGGWSLLLGSQTIEMHDDHHLNFYGNYGLSYDYLDRVFGTYREPQPRTSHQSVPEFAKSQ